MACESPIQGGRHYDVSVCHEPMAHLLCFFPYQGYIEQFIRANKALRRRNIFFFSELSHCIKLYNVLSDKAKIDLGTIMISFVICLLSFFDLFFLSSEKLEPRESESSFKSHFQGVVRHRSSASRP